MNTEKNGNSDTLITSLQSALQQERLEGWLFYDFRGSDPIAANILRLHHVRLATRRWFYFVPASGPPQKIVHAIESAMLDSLPGDKRVYRSWQELHQAVAGALSGAGQVAMQYSPLNAIPYVSRVDAGVVELVRSFGVEVVSSADLVQMFEAVWTPEQLETHLFAARHLREIVDAAFREAGRRIRENVSVTELDIQDFIWNEFAARNLESSDRPIVAVNAHSADPHYQPDPARNASIGRGDFLLLDIWAKRRAPHAVYDDITWTGYAGSTVPAEMEHIFNVVKNGRDAAIRLVKECYPRDTLFGWQVDDAARQSITAAGYGPQFLHRTGHSIHEEDHGNGANIDNLETQDSRRLLRGTCFSIEPGVYLEGRFGVRSEVNVYLDDAEAVVTGLPIQERVVPIPI
ncbi:MAG TPA: M24 family metallopeptidase [Terriglobia bacterium]|nr:M24 family metallopeptidase [Terriglobia bacterium]